MTFYLRPTAFVDTPVGFDGQVHRLAGGMAFFCAYEVTENGARRLVPVGDIDNHAPANLITRITSVRPPLALGARTIRLDQPQVMGILNMTPDSFSDGGRHDGDVEAAAAAGFAMDAAGASIIDVGGESTRPGAKQVWEGDEIARTRPVIERLARGGATISIDSRKASVMEAALSAGATIVNDVSALGFDKQAMALAAKGNFPVIIMHWPDAATHEPARGGNALFDTYDWLSARIETLEVAGVARSRIIVDPGIGFGKGVAENLTILNGLSLFHGLGCPILLGASRKRFIGALSNEAPVEARLGGSLAVAMKAAEQGAQIIRVHDVAETVQALRIWRGLRDQGLSS